MALRHESRLAGNHDSGVGMDDYSRLWGPATALATITARNAAQGDPGENSDDQASNGAIIGLAAITRRCRTAKLRIFPNGSIPTGFCAPVGLFSRL